MPYKVHSALVFTNGGMYCYLKNEMSLPCLRRTGLLGRFSFELVLRGVVPCGWNDDPAGGVPGSDKCAGTLSPMIRTHSDGKKPTSKPRLPLHHTLSSGAGMSITDIISPTYNRKQINTTFTVNSIINDTVETDTQGGNQSECASRTTQVSIDTHQSVTKSRLSLVCRLVGLFCFSKQQWQDGLLVVSLDA